MKLILITGSTGFIGKNILKSKIFNKYNIICVNRKKTFKKKNFLNINFKNIKTIRNFNIDLLIHLASADPENCKPELILKKNSKLDKTLLFLKKENIIKKILFTSSNSIFQDNKEEKIFSTTSPKPISAYGRSKLKTEKIIKKNFKSFIILRLPSVIGHGLKKGLIFRFLQKIKKKEVIKVYNKNKKFNNIFDINDLIKIILNYLSYNYNIKKTLNICSIDSISIFDVLKFLYRIKNKEIKITDCGISKNYKYFFWKQDIFLKKIKFKKIKKILTDNI